MFIYRLALLTIFTILGMMILLEDTKADEGQEAKDIKCLTEVLYYEARGEFIKRTVVDVVLNRVKSKHFPKSICRVVYQPYQFSFTLDKHRTVRSEEQRTWNHLYNMASEIYYDNEYTDTSKGALYYYNPRGVKATPSWVTQKYYLFTEGNHKFYSYHKVVKF